MSGTSSHNPLKIGSARKKAKTDVPAPGQCGAGELRVCSKHAASSPSKLFLRKTRKFCRDCIHCPLFSPVRKGMMVS